MSTAKAKSYHSINIGSANTWDSWFLVPTSRPLVNPPSVKTHFVTVPGASGVLDLSEYVSGEPVYGNRTGSWEFYVMNFWQLAGMYDAYNPRKSRYTAGQIVVYDGESILKCVAEEQPSQNGFDMAHWEVVIPNVNNLWQQRYTDISEFLHGKEFTVILDDDPDYSYKGRLAVDSWKSSPGNSTIVISYNLSPHKVTLRDQNEDWLWDPFSFIDGVIRSYKNIQITGSKTIVYTLNMPMTEHPIITTSDAGMTVSYLGTVYSLKKGKNVMNQFMFDEGDNVLTFTGTGKVTIKSTGGIL